MKKMTATKRLTATFLAILTIFFTFSMGAFALGETGGAKVVIGTEESHYDSISDAWNAVASSKEKATITLYEDWTADENGNLGTGKGFRGGAIFLSSREAKVTIDLNGFKIDRALTEKRANGSLFIFELSEDILITDKSEAKTGTLTGGNNSGNGGAAQILGSKVKLENITVSNNKSSSRGGAFYIKTCDNGRKAFSSKVVVDNCVITENKATTGGAIYLNKINSLYVYDSVVTNNKAIYDGGIHTEVLLLDVSCITLGGKVIIADNIAEEDGVGLTLDESFIRKVYVRYDKKRPLDKESRIVILGKTDDKTLRITDDAKDNYIECYEYENDDYKIIAKGSGNSKYLDIKKK